MFKKRLLNKFIAFFICSIFIFCNVLVPTALAYDGVRDDEGGCNVPTDPKQLRASNPCYIVNFNNSNNKCEVGNIKFSAMLPLNRDIEWELFPLPGNQYCMVFASVHIALLIAAGVAGSFACSTTGLSGALSAGTAIPGIGPQNLINQVLLANLCGAAIFQCAATAGVACPTVAPCCASAVAYATILAASVAELAIIFAFADGFFKETQICGWKWKGWKKETISSTEENQRGPKWEVDKGPYRKCIENIFNTNPTSKHKTASEIGDSNTINSKGIVPAYTFCGDSTAENINRAKEPKNKAYREYIFGGMEYEDNGSNSCSNPWSEDERMKILGYKSSNQRYYFTGSGEGSTPNFACYRFLQRTASDPTGVQAQEAYDCCVNRSQDILCVESPTLLCKGGKCDNISYKFCENNSKCDIEGVTFEVFYGKRSSNYLCAKSYSVCPYNQTVAGGSEIAKYDEDPNYTDVKLNFCQHLNHCWKAPLQPTVHSSQFTGNFISSACYDMKGDSQNTFQFSAGQLPIATRHFTAPFVQCFKETMENVFLNLAGHDVCRDPSFNSLPNCGGDANILYKEGTNLPDDQSFFKKIQDNYRLILKMVLTISLMMLGISTLLAVPKAHLEKKVIMTYIIKLGLVMYFALGDAWQMSFANAVLNTSSIMSDITFRPNIYNGNYAKLDGCQFPRFNYESKNERDYTKQAYPPGKEYLRIWDTLDCKIIRALGFGPDISVPNILLIIIAGFFSSALGVIFFVAAFVFGFMLLSISIRAMHIFLISTSAIIILLFISPITITMVMFERTKKVFENWWKQLLGYALQPMILFIYISILLTVMDSILIGSGSYIGGNVQIAPDKRYVGMTAIDSQNATDNFGFIVEKNVDCSINNAVNDSIYCIFNLAKFGKLSGFDAIGIGFPIITNLNKEKIETIAKSALIMFIFLNFIDRLSLFASKLVGGSEVGSDWRVKTSLMAKGMNDLMRGIQKRGMRAMVKHGPTVARKGLSVARGTVSLASDIRNLGKQNPGDDKNAAGGAGRGIGGDKPANIPQTDPKTDPATPDKSSSSGGDFSAKDSKAGASGGDFSAKDSSPSSASGGDFSAQQSSTNSRASESGGDFSAQQSSANQGGSSMNKRFAEMARKVVGQAASLASSPSGEGRSGSASGGHLKQSMAKLSAQLKAKVGNASQQISRLPTIAEGLEEAGEEDKEWSQDDQSSTSQTTEQDQKSNSEQRSKPQESKQNGLSSSASKQDGAKENKQDEKSSTQGSDKPKDQSDSKDGDKSANKENEDENSDNDQDEDEKDEDSKQENRGNLQMMRKKPSGDKGPSRSGGILRQGQRGAQGGGGQGASGEGGGRVSFAPTLEMGSAESFRGDAKGRSESKSSQGAIGDNEGRQNLLSPTRQGESGSGLQAGLQAGSQSFNQAIGSSMTGGIKIGANGIDLGGGKILQTQGIGSSSSTGKSTGSNLPGNVFDGLATYNGPPLGRQAYQFSPAQQTRRNDGSRSEIASRVSDVIQARATNQKVGWTATSTLDGKDSIGKGQSQAGQSGAGQSVVGKSVVGKSSTSQSAKGKTQAVKSKITIKKPSNSQDDFYDGEDEDEGSDDDGKK